jgi:hypothetical protein
MDWDHFKPIKQIPKFFNFRGALKGGGAYRASRNRVNPTPSLLSILHPQFFTLHHSSFSLTAEVGVEQSILASK